MQFVPLSGLKCWESSPDGVDRMHSYRLLDVLSLCKSLCVLITFQLFTQCPLVVFWSQGHFWSLLFRTDSFEWL